MYFENCANLDELKAAYKAAALKHHPDMGGDVEEMKRINLEYDRYFNILKDLHNIEADKDGSKVRRTTETPEEFIAIVSALLKLDGLEVELCGSWLWIAGNTYSHKDALKAAGCLWSRSKRKWYWRHAEDGCTWSRGSQTMEEIRETYGSEWLKEPENKPALTA